MPQETAGAPDHGARCLRCRSLHTIPLEKAVAAANTCYLCRACGHIFSPAAAPEEPRPARRW